MKLSALIFSFAVSFFVSVWVLPLQASTQYECGKDALGLDCGEYTGLGKEDPRILAGRIINVALGLLGILATVLIIYAGFRWMIAGGNEDNVKKAQQILFASVAGLIIILGAYAISTFVLKSLYEATTQEVLIVP